jgi:hypothetical protein
MSLRFRKSIKIMPGVRINVSRSGISTSAGLEVRPSMSIAAAKRVCQSASQELASAIQILYHLAKKAVQCRRYAAWTLPVSEECLASP